MISQPSIAIVTKTIAIGAVKYGRVSLRLCFSLALSIVVSIAKTMETITIAKMPSIAIVTQSSIPIGTIKKGWVSLRFRLSLTLAIIVTISKPVQTIPVTIMSEPSITIS